jgi:tetratricopeptide (TPR) repeat protein
MKDINRSTVLLTVALGAAFLAFSASIPISAQQPRAPEGSQEAPPKQQSRPKSEPPPSSKLPPAPPKSAQPNGQGPPAAGQSPTGQAQGKAQPKGYSTALPKSPAEREKTLADLYAHLATAEDEAAAKSTTEAIERLWAFSGSDTATVLMERAQAAVAAKNFDLAIKFLDAIVEMKPDYAEAWNRRAIVHHMRNDVDRALGDLRRTLALEPSHYRALDGLTQILKDIGQKKAALRAARALMDVHPNWPSIKQTVDELARDVEGQGI